MCVTELYIFTVAVDIKFHIHIMHILNPHIIGQIYSMCFSASVENNCIHSFLCASHRIKKLHLRISNYQHF